MANEYYKFVGKNHLKHEKTVFFRNRIYFWIDVMATFDRECDTKFM